MEGISGGPGRVRTDDLFHAMEARSQLRHRPTFREHPKSRALIDFLAGRELSQTVLDALRFRSRLFQTYFVRYSALLRSYLALHILGTIQVEEGSISFRHDDFN